MAQILNLPILTDGNKFIVVNEGVDATYAQYLIIAWLQAIRKKGSETRVNILLFSQLRYNLERCIKSVNLTNINVYNYFNIDLLSEQVDVYKELTTFCTQNLNSIIVIDCLSTLALQIGIAKTCRFIEKLSQNHKLPVFCIYRRDFYQNIPRIETLGNIYIKLKKSKKVAFQSDVNYEVSITHKKAGGSVVHWNELIQQNVETYSLESEKIAVTTSLKTEINKSTEANIKPQASFRIEKSEQEIKQRDSVALPYILPGNPGGESKIIYVPDDADDLDEEDPDDDLDI